MAIDKQAMALATADRLRDVCRTVRVRPIPLAHLIPVMQQAADMLDALIPLMDKRIVAAALERARQTLDEVTYYVEKSPSLAADVAATLAEVKEAQRLSAYEDIIRLCGNAECGWAGQTQRMCGGVGPLCPECGEVTEAASEDAKEKASPSGEA